MIKSLIWINQQKVGLVNFLVVTNQFIKHEVGEDVVLAVEMEVALRTTGSLFETPADAVVAKAVTALCHVRLLEHLETNWTKQIDIFALGRVEDPGEKSGCCGRRIWAFPFAGAARTLISTSASHSWGHLKANWGTKTSNIFLNIFFL